MRSYLFVDAESHYHRSLAVAQRIVGSKRAHEAFAKTKFDYWVPSSFPRHIDGNRFGWRPTLQLFWDCSVYHAFDRQEAAQPNRAVYVCSCVGDDDDIHNMRVDIRALGFEPIVVREPKDHFKQRVADRQKHKLIEKPKGCDIALATRMVSDAAANLYDACCVFTSDVDFLPAVEAIRRMGKVVAVAGYKSAFGKRSPFLFAPDLFIDLERELERAWTEMQPDVIGHLRALGETVQLNAKPEFARL